MATRGTAMLITNEEVLFGPEFNGNMFPNGYGDRFMEMFEDIENNPDFIKMNNQFNKRYFGYDKIMSNYQGKFNHEDLQEDGVFTANKIYNGVPNITSDWIFVKNATDNDIMFTVSLKDENYTIGISPGRSFRLESGELY